MSDDDSGRPVLKVIRGDATPEEIAALLAVIAASSSVVVEEKPAPTSAWNDRASALRRPVAAGPGAWRASGWLR